MTFENDTWDYVVIGSGFGGAVSAMRLAEKGYSVLVIEKGRRWKDDEFPKSNWNFRRYFWAPWLNWLGIQKIDFFKQIFVLSGTGVGGGSLVYANTHMMPPDSFYSHPDWASFKDWESSLAPYYRRAKFMLGTSDYRQIHLEDEALIEIAAGMGKLDKFGFVDGVGVNLTGKSGEDPYFGGLGPEREPCIECAGCMVGCRHNAKNTLEKNYLWFAEEYGARILPETEAFKITQFENGYRINVRATSPWKRRGSQEITAGQVILSGGVLGTLKLLFMQKHHYRTLPGISERLGDKLRTNSEMLAGVTATQEKVNHGLAISTIFHPDDHTHVELCKYPDGSGLMNFLGGPAVGGGAPWRRTLAMLRKIILHPIETVRIIFQRNRARTTVFLLVMQELDSALKMSWKKAWWGKGTFRMKNMEDEKVPAFIPQGQQVNLELAKKLGGVALNGLPEVIFGTPSTAHILGGCPMGRDVHTGVVDDHFRLHGYPGIRIIDGSIVPANLGVNPSLTITALAEYAMDHIDPKSGNQKESLDKRLKKLADHE